MDVRNAVNDSYCEVSSLILIFGLIRDEQVLIAIIHQASSGNFLLVLVGRPILYSQHAEFECGDERVSSFK